MVEGTRRKGRLGQQSPGILEDPHRPHNSLCEIALWEMAGDFRLACDGRESLIHGLSGFLLGFHEPRNPIAR